MYDKNQDIASLISARICHDLVSPIGAIRNGIELLELSGVTPSVELELINQSAESANARLSYFRIAFGSAASDTIMSHSEIENTLNANFADKRVNIVWDVKDDQRRPEVKCMFLLIQCFETGLPYGGEITVRKATNSWIISAKGEREKFDSDDWKGLTTTGHIDLQSSNIHFELARQTILAQDIKATWDIAGQNRKVILEM